LQRRREGTLRFSIHHDSQAREGLTLDLDEIARAGARRMLAHALEAEVDAYIEAAKDQRDENGHALVVRKVGTPRSARSSVGPEPWRSRSPGSTTAGSTSMESAGVSGA
jgi:hypothetical protein